MNNVVALEEVCEFLDNQRKPVTAKDRVSGKYPYYGANGIQDYVDQYLFDDELVLLAEDGGHFDDPSKGVAYRISGKSWVNNHAHVLKPKNNIDVDYLGYVLRQYDVRPYITGAIVKKLNQKAARKMLIPLPAIEKQKKIVKILNEANLLRQKRKKAISLLDDYLNSIFFEIFGDPVQNSKNWDRLELKSFGEIITGNTPPRNEKDNYSSKFIEWIKTDNIIEDNVYLSHASEYLSETGLNKARCVESGALLVACIAGSIASIGRAAIADRKVSFNQQINAIQPNEKINSLFLYWLLRNTRKYIQAHATRGMKRILTKGEFEKIKMIMPPIDLQNKFAAVALDAENLKRKMLGQSKELENQFQALMHESFAT